MGLTTVEHSYACSVLQERGIKIFADGKEILDQKYPLKFPKLTSSLKIGDKLNSDIKSEIIEITKDYDFVKKLGWKISSGDAPGRDFDYQKIGFFLTPVYSRYNDHGSIPKDHKIKIDFDNQLIKFVGKNVSVTGDTPWKHLNPIHKEKMINIEFRAFQHQKMLHKSNDFVQNLMPNWAKPKYQNYIQIPEPIIGITRLGEICCLNVKKKSEEEKIDAPVISISGQRGHGKTLLENNLEGQLKHKTGYNIMNMNDKKPETQTRCLPWEPNHLFNKDLKRYYEPTVPLPYIYLHPNFSNLTQNDILYLDEVGFRVSFPFRDFLLDTNLIKYNKQWKTSPTSNKYLRNMVQDKHGNQKINGLLYVKSLEEAEELVDKTINEQIGIENKETSNMLLGSKISIKNLIRDIWSRNILDKSSRINSKWVIKIKDMEFAEFPWNACLMCGLVPSIITKPIQNEDWFPMYERLILDSVFKFKKTKLYQTLQNNKPLMLCGDEIKNMLKDKATFKIIDDVIGEGRSDDIGMTQVLQHLSDIPDSIITNVTHYFVFQTRAKDDWAFLKSKFDLTPIQIKQITKLKKFQCTAFGDFVLYNSNGERYSNDSQPVDIIKIKYPNAQNYGGSATMGAEENV